jgi:hypothetical protein
MSFKSEEDLRQSFLRYASPSLWSRPISGRRVRTVMESSCSEGRADWVWAGISCDWPDGLESNTAYLLRQPTCSRILGFLKPEAVRSEPFLYARTGVSTPTFRRWMMELIECGLVKDLGKRRYVLGPKFAIPQIEICSFEFKLENWKRAFYQAKRYRTFSHRVYVVMPSRTISRVNGSLEHFRRFNIGLIAHDVDGDSKRLLQSFKREPFSRSRFIRALGMLFD